MASLNQLSEFTSNIIAPKGKASKDIMEDIQLNRVISKNVFNGNRILVTSEKGVSDSSEFSPNNLNHLDGTLYPIQTQINDIKSTISSNLPNIVDIHSKDLIISASNIQNQVSSHLSSITFDNIANGTQNKFIVNDTIQGDINVTGRITANNLEVTGTYTKYVTDKYVADNIIVNDGNITITDDSQLQPGSALTLTQNGLQNILEVYSQKETTTNNLTIKQNGRVGMGIANPTEILDIRGDMHFSGTMNGVTSNEFSALANTKGNLQEQINTLSSGFVGNNTSIDLTNQITSNIVATVENKVSQQITISSNNAIHYYEDICENKQDNLVFGNGLSLVNDTLELTANITTAWTDNSNHISFGNVHVYNDQIIIGDNTSVVADTAVETTPVFTSGLKYPREPLVGDTTTYTDGTVVKIRVQSSYHVNYQKHYLFNGNNNGWASPSFTYARPSGVAKNTYRTGVANEDIYPGEYVMIDLGEEIILDYIKAIPATGYATEIRKAPNEFRIYASNTNTSYDDINDPSWVLLYEGNNPTDGTSVETETYIVDNNIQSYRYYVMIINKVFDADMVRFSELELYSKIQTNQTASFGDDTTDMLAWYKFEDTNNPGLDSSGNNNNMLGYTAANIGNTSSLISGDHKKYGDNSFYKTSTYDSLRLIKDVPILTSNFTLSFWIFHTQLTTGTQTYIATRKRRGTGFNGFLIYKSGGNIVSITIISRETYVTSLDVHIPWESVNYNSWNHIVYNIDTATKEINVYLNGVLYLNAIDTNSNIDLSLTIEESFEMAFGAQATGAYNYYYSLPDSYYMDDVRVYKRALTESEVTDLYNYVPGAVGTTNNNVTTTPVFGDETADMVVWYKFEGDFTDSSGNGYDLTPNLKTPQFTNNSKYGNNSVWFEGNTQWNSTPNKAGLLLDNLSNRLSSHINTSITISLWVYTLGKGQINYGHIFSGIASNNYRFDSEFKILYKNNTEILGFISNDNYENVIDVTSDGGEPFLNRWVHIVWILDGTNTSIYIDGVKKIDRTDYRFPVITDTYTFSIGAWNVNNPNTGGARDINGYLDDFRIYKRVLTEEEVTDLYNYVPGAVKSSVPNNQVATLDSLDNKQTSLRWMGISRMLFNNFQPNVVTVSDQYGKVNVSDISADSLNTLSDTRSNINTQINTLSNNHQTLRNNLQSANNTWNTNTSNYIKNTVQTAINTISTTKLSTDVVFSTGFIQDGNNISLDSEMTISSESVNNTSSTYWELHYKYGSNIPPEIIINNSLTNNNTSASFGDDTTDMIAWYKFDGDVTDSSGNGNDPSRAISVTYDSNIKINDGSSLKLNGTTYLQIENPGGDNTYFTPPSMTISTWIYGSTNSSLHQSIASARLIPTNIMGWTLFILPASGILQFWYFTIDESEKIINYIMDTGYKVTHQQDSWIHLAVTIHEKNLNFYVNGSLHSTYQSTFNFINSAPNLRIGAGANENDSPLYYLNNGTKLDDFRMYNRALTASEVADLYNYVPGAVGTTTTSGSSFGDVTTDMLAWYKLDGDVTDSSGNGNDLTIVNPISEQYDSTLKKIGSSSMNFNSSLFATVANDDLLYFTPTTMTLSVWIYNAQIHTSYQGIASARYYNSGGYGWTLYIVQDTGELTIWIGEGPGRYWNDTSFGYNINQFNTEWTHIVITLNNNIAKFYINNVFISESTIPRTIYYGGAFNLGSANNGSFPLKTGTKLDDFRLYNRVLTVDEISELYNYVPGAVSSTTMVYSYGDVQIFPPAALPSTDASDLTARSSSATLSDLPYGNGDYYISYSSRKTTSGWGFTPSGIFNNENLTLYGSAWQQSGFNNSGEYIGEHEISGNKGEWIRLKLPLTIKLSYIEIYRRREDIPEKRAPLEYKIFGTNNDGVSWTEILSVSNVEYINGDGIYPKLSYTPQYGKHTSPVPSTEYGFNEFAILFTKISTNSGTLGFDDLLFYGAEEFAIETQVSVPFYTDTQNLLLWYKFDKNNFTTNSGNLGSAYDVTQNSALVDTSIRMKGDGAANLDGSYMIIQSDLDFTANTIISICFWTKITQLHSEWDTVLYKEMSASNAIKIQRNAATNYWSIQFGAAHVTTDGFLNDFTLDDTSWRHYCFTFVKTGDNVTFKIFKNAGVEPVFTQEVTNTWPSVPIGKVSIGDPTYPLRHFIDDLRFYDRELIVEELEQLYKYEPPVVDYITYKNTSEVVPDKYLKYYPDKLAIAYNLQNISKVSIIHNDAIEEPTAIPGSGGYKYFAFTSTTGINSITFDRDTVCDVLVVGGGGSGGYYYGGGGGGGAVIHATNVTIPATNTYNVIVGKEGSYTSSGTGRGGDSSIFGAIAKGGAPGNIQDWNNHDAKPGLDGGSGSGARLQDSGLGLLPNPGGQTTITEQDFGDILTTSTYKYIYGNDGGIGIVRTSGNYVGSSGGGGGAGEKGYDGYNADTSTSVPFVGGNGGDGIGINITGNTVYYGAGGGGAGYDIKAGNGGMGGGGGGSSGGPLGITGYGGYSDPYDTIKLGEDAIESKAGDGADNTGSGGGGAYWKMASMGHGYLDSQPGDGGSGIVIIRWYSPESEYPVAEVDELVTKQDAIYFGDGLKYNSTTKELTAGGWNDKKTHVSHGDVSFAKNTLSLYKGERVNTYAAFQPSRKYPDVSLTAATTVSPYTSQNHIVQWSSEEATTNYRGHHLFNGDRADVGWISGKKYYKDGDTIPAGSVAGDAIDTSSYIGDDSDNYGEWVKIELDKAIYLSYVQIYERRITGWSHRNPVFYVIYGSNDGNTWTQLIVNKTIEATYSTDADRVHTSEKVVPTQKYKHFAITVTKQGGTGGDCGFAELELYGNEHINVSTSVITESLNTAKLGSIETNNVITKNISSIDSGPINLGKHIEIHNTTDTMSSQHMMMSSNITDVSSDDKSYCMRAKRDIWIDGADIVWTSDERIKKDIQDIDDDGALQKILAIEPKTYKYIDHLERGKNKVYGFISQQVRDVIPEATTQTKKYIPNIYKYCPYFGKTIVLPKDFDISTIVTTYNGKLLSDKLRLISSSGQATDVSFVMNGDADSRYTMTITGRIPGDGRDVFVYGTEIDDMTTIDKSYIYTLNVCATQTLSRKTDIVDANSSNLLSRTSELEQRIADIESKMSQ